MLVFARALQANGVPVPEIVTKLTIKTGKNAGGHPSVVSLYRALAESDPQDAAPRQGAFPATAVVSYRAGASARGPRR
ncbi:hypothetical protein [Streptosporangium sp. KLBMP 9127]|nr:hypothetical protein [Streptosporangium sp. KLBMP 9127]